MKKLRSKERSNAVWIIIVFIVMGLSFILTNNAGNQLLSASRAYISENNQWTKAQKQVSLALVKYIQFGDERSRTEYLESFDIIEDDGQQYIYREPGPPDTSHEIYVQENNRPNVPYLMKLYWALFDLDAFFVTVKYLEEGGRLVESLRILGEEFDDQHQNGEVTQNQKTDYIHKIYELDEKLTVVGNNLSIIFDNAVSRISTLVYRTSVIMGVIFATIGGVVIVFLIKSIKMWNNQLQKTDQQFKNALENSRDVIYQMSLKTGTYEYMSPAVEKMTGYTVEEIIAGGPRFMLGLTHPQDLERMSDELQGLEDFSAGRTEIPDTEFRILTKDGSYIWVNNKRTVVRSEEGGTSIIGSVRDITEYKKYVDALDKSLSDKEMLLSEIHHRVKNNLSIVSSLIELQKGNINQNSEEVFHEIQSRIKSIALVHEKLYQTENLADVDLAEYIQDLSRMISSTYSSSNLRIKLTEDLEPQVASITKAVPIGLVCNELLNNCYKHAFQNKNEGEIAISLKSIGENIHFTVADNGVGLPEGFNIDEQTSLGMTLLKAFTQQIDGELEYESDSNGTYFSVHFPPPASSGRS